MTLEGANGGDRERRKPVLSATPPHSTTGPKQPFEKDWPSLDQGLPLREHHQGRKDCGPSWRHTGGAQALLCGSWWLPTAPQALVPGSVPHPTQGHKDEAPTPAPKSGVHVDPLPRCKGLHPGLCLGRVITMSPSQILLCLGPAAPAKLYNHAALHSASPEVNSVPATSHPPGKGTNWQLRETQPDPTLHSSL